MNGKISYFREMYGSDRNIKETNRRKNDTDSETWGCFTFSGVGHLHRNDSTLTTEKFHSFLWRHATICGLHLCGEGFMLQQVNEPKQTSKL